MRRIKTTKVNVLKKGRKHKRHVVFSLVRFNSGSSIEGALITDAAGDPVTRNQGKYVVPIDSMNGLETGDNLFARIAGATGGLERSEVNRDEISPVDRAVIDVVLSVSREEVLEAQEFKPVIGVRTAVPEKGVLESFGLPTDLDSYQRFELDLLAADSDDRSFASQLFGGEAPTPGRSAVRDDPAREGLAVDAPMHISRRP